MEPQQRDHEFHQSCVSRACSLVSFLTQQIRLCQKSPSQQTCPISPQAEAAGFASFNDVSLTQKNSSFPGSNLIICNVIKRALSCSLPWKWWQGVREMEEMDPGHGKESSFWPKQTLSRWTNRFPQTSGAQALPVTSSWDHGSEGHKTQT